MAWARVRKARDLRSLCPKAQRHGQRQRQNDAQRQGKEQGQRQIITWKRFVAKKRVSPRQGGAKALRTTKGRQHRKAKDEGTKEAAQITGMAAGEEGGYERNMAAKIFHSPFRVLSE